MSAPVAKAEEHSSVGVVIGSIAILLLLASLDQTIVSTALPTIVSDLGGLDHLSWVVTAYILSSTVVAPLYGKLGDLYGRRVIVFVAVGIFLAGSALCGLAQSMAFLIVSRAIQGLGGGGLFVLALSIIGDVIQPKDRGKVQGVFAAVFSISSIIGPLIGGWFVENASWHWIFYINLPFGILALAGFALGFHAHPGRVDHKIDYLGAVLLTVSLACVVLITSLGGRSLAWSSPEIWAMGVLAVVTMLAFLYVEARASEPVLPLGLFRLNVFWVTSLIGFVAGASMFGAITFLPLYLQIVQGSTPTLSGLQLIPMTFGILTASTLAGRMMGKTGRYRMLPIIGTTLLILGMGLLSTLGTATPYWQVGIYIAIVGLGMGNIFPVVTTAVQNAVPRQMMGTATASGILFRQVGGSLAVALFGAIFANRIAEGLGGAGAAVSGHFSPEAVARLPEAMRQMVATTVVDALHPIYWIAAGVAAVGLVFSFMLEEIPLTNRMVPKGE